MKNYKNILLSGFTQKRISNLKKIFKKLNFINYKKNRINKSIDAFVSTNRISFEKFYNNDLDKLKNELSWIHIAAAGVENYSKILNLNNECVVTNGRIIQGPEVADHALALLLGITRNLNTIIKHGPNKKFIRRPIELRKKRILIVGYGGVGQCVAERVFGFGAKVSVVNKFYTPITNFVEHFYLEKDYTKSLKDKDVVIYALPLTSKTKKMYNSKTAKNFKRGAILINVCRGGVVCKKTLYKNLKNNYLGGAGVDELEGTKVL